MEDELCRRDRSTRRARGKHGIALSVLHHARRDDNRGVLLGAHCLRRSLVHTDHIRRMNDGNVQGIRIRSAQLRANLCLIADQYDLAVVFLRRINGPADNLLRRKIAAHRINCYTHPALPSPLSSSFSE